MSKFHSGELRSGRVSEAGRIYHLRTSTASKRQLFHDFWIGRIVVCSMRFLHDRGDVDSLAFVVMPNHLHWLVRLNQGRTLDGVMGSLKSYTAHRINQRLERSGAVWQDGYFDRALRAEDDLRAIARYIVANPLRAGLCRRIGDYPLWDAEWL